MYTSIKDDHIWPTQEFFVGEGVEKLCGIEEFKLVMNSKLDS